MPRRPPLARRPNRQSPARRARKCAAVCRFSNQPLPDPNCHRTNDAASRGAGVSTMARAQIDWKSKLPKPTWEMVRRPFYLPEGWGTFALVALMVLIVQAAILRAEWAPELKILPSETWEGLLAGFVLARITRLRNIYAHLIGIGIGIVTIWFRTLSVIDDRF